MTFCGDQRGSAGAGLIGAFVVMAIFVLGFFAFIGVHLVRGLFPGPSHVVPTTLSVSLTPTAGATDVVLTIQVAQNSTRSLPKTLSLNFVDNDSEIISEGPPSTHQGLTYTQAHDGTGRALPSTTPRSGGMTIKLPTDGRRATISFRIADVGGRKVIFPAPMTSEVWFRTVTVHTSGAMPSCQERSPLDPMNPNYDSCIITSNGQAVASVETGDSPQGAIRLVLPN